MVPEKLHARVDIHSRQGQPNKPEEHLEHREDGGLIEDIFSCPFVDKVQHLVRCDMAIGLADAPLELLKIHFLLYFAHHRHVRLGDHKVRSPSEAKFGINVHDLGAVGHLGEKGGEVVLVNNPHILVEVDHVLIFGEEVTE